MNDEHKPKTEINPESAADVAKSIAPYVKLLWNNKWKIILFNFVVAVVTGLILVLFVNNYYTSTVTILPEFGGQGSQLSQFSGVASMFGVNLGESTPVEIYQNLTYSEAVLHPVITKKYSSKNFDEPVTLIKLYEIEPDETLSEEDQKRKMYLDAQFKLSKKIAASVDKKTNILTITVEMPEPQLSAEVANTIASSIDDYVRNKRKTYASEQRFYLEKRVEQIKDSLAQAENELRTFREKNRQALSPSLKLEELRLMRVIEMRQRIFTEITIQLELVKLDEIKETPVLNIREVAGNPVVKAGPKRSVILLITMVMVFGASLVFVMITPHLREYIELVKKNM